MKTKFNFNSQICTSREQSERLVALGLKKETADCYLFEQDGETSIVAKPYSEIEKQLEGLPHDCAIYPAWSLDRLIEMALRYVLICGISFTFNEDAYEKVIGIIEHQIKEGYFNKEYLV